MSLEIIRNIFSNLSGYDFWTLQLLQIKKSNDNGTSYFGRKIILSPSEELKNFIAEISEHYLNDKKGVLNTYQSFVDYDGSILEKVIYKLSCDSELICTEYSSFVAAISDPDEELDPFKREFQAYLLDGMITVNDNELPVQLISMQNPVTTLKHKFSLAGNNRFKKIQDKVLNLRTGIDVVIFDKTIYMLTLAGENLFNMERSYRTICNKKIKEIMQSNMVTDADIFSVEATKGHNPRRFVSFNESRFQKLKNISYRKKMSEKFNIPIKDNKFDTKDPDVTDKLIKLLCNRGMTDPFEDNKPVEVAGSKKWE